METKNYMEAQEIVFVDMRMLYNTDFSIIKSCLQKLDSYEQFMPSLKDYLPVADDKLLAILQLKKFENVFDVLTDGNPPFDPKGTLKGTISNNSNIYENIPISTSTYEIIWNMEHSPHVTKVYIGYWKHAGVPEGLDIKTMKKVELVPFDSELGLADPAISNFVDASTSFFVYDMESVNTIIEKKEAGAQVAIAYPNFLCYVMQLLDMESEVFKTMSSLAVKKFEVKTYDLHPIGPAIDG